VASRSDPGGCECMGAISTSALRMLGRKQAPTFAHVAPERPGGRTGQLMRYRASMGPGAWPLGGVRYLEEPPPAGACGRARASVWLRSRR
jgi:hypothetical protein